MQKPSVLLAYGEKVFSRALQKALEERRYAATILSSGPPPRASYDFILQLASDPTDLTQGTRQLLEKMVKDRARFFLVAYRSDEQLYQESFRFAQSLTLDFERKFGISVNTLRLGRLFGPQIAKEDSGALGFLVHEFTEGEILTIYGGGEEKDYYLYVDDAYAGIAHALGKAEAGITYSIAPKATTSALSIAKLLSELGEGRHEIHYHRGLVALDEQGAVEGEPLPQWREKFSLREGILEILKTQSTQAISPHRKMLPSLRLPALPLPRISFKKPSPIFLKWALIILLLFSPILYLAGETAFAFYQLTRAKDEAAGFNFPAASSSARQAAASFERIERWEKIIPILGAAAIAKEVALATYEATANGDLAAVTLENFMRSRQGLAVAPQTQEQFRSLAANFSASEDHLAVATIEADKLTSPFSKGFIQAAKSGLADGLELVRLGRSFWGQAYDLLGYQGPRNYLVLFQNSAEIWAGGGPATSLALVTLESGAIKDLAFYDLYDFQNVVPPAEEQPPVFGGPRSQLYLLLSPDFASNAAFTSAVFRAGTGVAVDGIIGIDLHFTEKLLEETGPFYLADFEKEVSASNLFEVAESTVEKGFFPGSTKKKRFMQALGEGLLEKIFAIKRENYAAISRLAWEQLKQKGILLYFNNASFYQEVIESNFAGLVRSGSGDYLFPLDHNVGTKGTIWIKRMIEYKVFNTDREGKMRGELKITWKNEGGESWPAGIYPNYFRVLVPKGAQLVTADLESGDVTGEVGFAEEEGKDVFYLPTNIDPQRQKTLRLLYDLPFNLSDLSTYELLLQHQPGQVSDRFKLTFEIPFGYETTSESLQKDGEALIFEGELLTDLEFTINLKAK